MAMAIGKGTTGTVIKDNIRKVTQGGGKAVDNAVDGLKAIAAGEKVDYAGASGPCDFDDKGDILDCQFRYEQIKAGKPVLVDVAYQGIWLSLEERDQFVAFLGQNNGNVRTLIAHLSELAVNLGKPTN